MLISNLCVSSIKPFKAPNKHQGLGLGDSMLPFIALGLFPACVILPYSHTSPLAIPLILPSHWKLWASYSASHANLNAQFSLKQLGNLVYSLGVEVTHLSNGSLLLPQTKYIKGLFNNANMSEAKGMLAPMVAILKLSKLGSNYLSIRPTTDPLLVLCSIQPSLESHWAAIKRIKHGLLLNPAPLFKPLSITIVSDVDWVWRADQDNRKSTFCIYPRPNLVAWWSRKQTLVAKSSTETEYRSLVHKAAEVLWLQSLLKELSCSKHLLYCDNLSTVALSHNPELHTKTKHMELDMFS